jgi:hypothetical protein
MVYTPWGMRIDALIRVYYGAAIAQIRIDGAFSHRKNSDSGSPKLGRSMGVHSLLIGKGGESLPDEDLKRG